jgi:hypothetical protein
LLVGLFVEHVAGVLGGEDAGSAFRMRADEVSALLERAGTDDHRGR